MQVDLINVGKRYNREWIFRHFNYTFIPGGKYAITGPNGAGKSTLLQVTGAAVLQSEGTMQYSTQGNPYPAEDIYQHIAIAAPYLELVEEMTIKEFLGFHTSFKPLQLPIPEIIEIIGLAKATHKQIRYFSSGMKQRLKLAQAIFSKTPVLLLDEPTTNLDADGIALYQQLIINYTNDKLVIVSSNDKQEYDFCNDVIDINGYKQFM